MTNMWTRRAAIAAMTAANVAVLTKPVFAVSRPSSKPNVIFIMADDLGYADLGCTGSRSNRTPFIDSIARAGSLLTHGYSNSPVCSATRTALMTGSYQYRFPIGLEEPLSPMSPAGLGLPFERSTMAEAFRAGGYQTALVGKWHLGEDPQNSPLAHGYDHFFGILPGGADYFRHRQIAQSREIGVGLLQGRTEIERAGYLTDLLGDEAANVIRSKQGPLFLSLHFTAPHWPWEGREDAEISRQLRNDLHTDGGSIATYANMVSAMDDNVGKVLAALTEIGELENTIVVFTSDNGGERFSDTWPFIGVKGELLEGGIRVPIVCQWPDRMAPQSQNTQVMASMDFLPTLLSAAGLSYDQTAYDGMDLSSQVFHGLSPLERDMFWRYQNHSQAALRSGDWKYLKMGDSEYLFNLMQDARERANLKDREPEIFERLKEQWFEWNATMLPYRAISEDQAAAMENYSRGLYADRY